MAIQDPNSQLMIAALMKSPKLRSFRDHSIKILLPAYHNSPFANSSDQMRMPVFKYWMKPFSMQSDTFDIKYVQGLLGLSIQKWKRKAKPFELRIRNLIKIGIKRIRLELAIILLKDYPCILCKVEKKVSWKLGWGVFLD